MPGPAGAPLDGPPPMPGDDTTNPQPIAGTPPMPDDDPASAPPGATDNGA